MSSHTPNIGSTYRIYSPDRTSYTSAVCIDDRSILEVKNPNKPNTKTKFDTLEDWRLSHGPDAVVSTIDDFRSKDFLGFYVPEETTDILKWPSWCLEMIARADPQLLQNSAVKVAYNNHVALCVKYKKSLGHSHYYYYRTDASYWDPKLLAWSSTRTDWNGKVVEDKWMSTGMSFYKDSYSWRKDDPNATDEVRNELLTSYKALYDLISPTLLPYLEKKYEEAKRKMEIRTVKRRIAAAMRDIERYKRNTEYTLKQLEKFRTDLATLEMKNAAIN
jgi:hypothetical protein